MKPIDTMSGNIATVIWDGIAQSIDEGSLQKGDYVLIQSGDIIPADLKLIESRSLEIDEFDITGELLPVAKRISSEDVFAYMGSRVVRGAAKGIVIAAGSETVYGNILAEAPPEIKVPRLQLNKSGQWTALILLLPGLILALLRSHNQLIALMLFVLTAFLLVLTQEGEIFRFVLLKREKQKMDRNHIAIKNIELLRCLEKIDIVCFDKTGVLTTRDIEVTKFFMGSSLSEIDASQGQFTDGLPSLVRTASALCTDISYFEARRYANPVDSALLSFAEKKGIDFKQITRDFQRIYDLPFDSEKRTMCSGYETEDQKRWYFMKGDPDVVVERCNKYFAENGKIKRFDFSLQSKIKTLSDDISKNGNTPIVMAVAQGAMDPEQSDFTFLCLAQFENTLQEGAKDTVERISSKGIRPLLLTGDKPEAAIKIAQDCGIAQKGSASLTGNVMDRMALGEVGRQAEYCSVFSRLMPAQKASIIRQLQSQNHHVMMVGDGPNDGIALKVSNVGVSFQQDSSAIARRLSSILLSELTDLPALFEGAANLALRIKKVLQVRVIISILMIAALYLYALL